MEVALADIERRLAPAPPQMIVAMLTALAEYYGVKKDQVAMEITLGMMVKDLAEFSVAHLDAAITEHRRERDFFPRSSEIRPLLFKRKAMALVFRHRARVLLGMEEPGVWEKRYLEDRLAKEAIAAPPKVDLESKLDGMEPDLARGLRRLLKAAADPEKDPARVGRDEEAA